MAIVFRFSIRKFESKPKIQARGYYRAPGGGGVGGINLVALIGICKCEMFIFMPSQWDRGNNGDWTGEQAKQEGQEEQKERGGE